MRQGSMESAMTTRTVPFAIFLAGEGPSQFQSGGKLAGHRGSGEQHGRWNRFLRDVMPETGNDIFLVQEIFEHQIPHVRAGISDSAK